MSDKALLMSLVTGSYEYGKELAAIIFQERIAATRNEIKRSVPILKPLRSVRKELTHGPGLWMWPQTWRLRSRNPRKTITEGLAQAGPLEAE